MAKISKLAVAAPLTGRETFPLVQQDQTRAATIDQFVGQIIPHVQNYYKGDKGDPGAADNTYDDLATFKGSPVTRLVASLTDIDGVEDGRFYWTPGDFTGAADTNSLILSTVAPATDGAWLRRRDGDAADLRNFGGSPFGQHPRNSAALASALASAAPRAIIAADSTAAKDWFFSDAWPVAQMAGFEVDVERACTLSHSTDTIITGQGGMVRYARPTRHRFRAINADYVSLPEGSLANEDKVSFLADLGPDHSRYLPVIVNDGRSLEPCKVAWPDSDAFAPDPYSNSTDRLYQHAPAKDGAFHLAMKRIFPGQRYFAVPAVQSGNPLLVAMVRHSKGFIGVMADLNYPPSINFIEKTIGQPAKQTPLGFSNFPADTHASYFPRNSEWAIDIEDWRSGSVLFNGVVVHRFRTDGFIHRVGFGMFPTAEGDVVGWEDPNIGLDLPRSAGQLFAGLFMGDSRMMLRDGCPSHFARKAMDLSFGVRTTRWDNAAIGGQASSQQLSVLNFLDLTIYNHVHIPLGTNDVQGGTVTPAQLIANLRAMADRARSQNCSVSFGIMPLWYGQGQAGTGRGQDSRNYEKSAPYRAAIRRFCAENGYPVLDCSMLTGPVLANYVNPALDLNLVGRGDPVVFDNIHLTALFNRIYGDAIAKLILGTLFAKRTLALGAQEIAGANGWSAGTEQPVVMIDQAGAVSCAGLIGGTGSASSTTGTVVCNLPPYACPSRTRRFVAVGSAGIGFVNVGTDGAVSIYGGLVGSAWVDLSSVQFCLDVY